MKIRTSFVSNSSSSSFVVAFPKEPTSVEAIIEMLFYPGQEEFYIPWDMDNYMEGTITHWPIRKVAEVIMEQLEGQKPNDFESIKETLRIWDESYPDQDDFVKSDGEIDWSAMNEVVEKIIKDKAENFLAGHPKSFTYRFKFSDNNGLFESALEHGDTFNRVAHLTIPNH